MIRSIIEKSYTLADKHGNAIIAVALILMGILIFFTLENGHVFGGDYAQYIEQSEAILSGQTKAFFEASKYAMDNSDRNIGPYLYPVGFPLLITPATLIWGMNLLAYKTILLVFFLLACAMTWFLFRNKFDQKIWPLIIALMLLFNYYFIVFLDLIGSDIPYLFFALLSIYLIENRRKSPNAGIQILMGLVITFAFLIRTSGISILFALVIMHVYDDFRIIAGKGIAHLWDTYFKLIPYLVFIAGLILNRIFYFTGEQNHFEILSDANLKTAFSNLAFYTGELKKFLILYYPAPSLILLLISLPFVFTGMYKNFRKDLLYLVFMGANLGIYAIWPEREGVRFMFPVVPFYFYFLLRGILSFHKVFSRWKPNLLPFALLLMIMVQGIFYSIRDFHHGNSSNILSPPATEAFEYIKKHTDKEAIFVFDKPRTLRLMTDRNAIAQSTPDGMLHSDASYLLTFREPAMDHPQFNLLFANREFRVYWIIQDTAKDE